MAEYFYFNAKSKRQGPVDEQQLKELAAQGVIRPETPISTGGSTAVFAKQIPGLIFNTVPNSESLGIDEKSPGFFDIGFTRFITNTWTSILWVLTIILAFVGCGGALVYAATNEAPILFLLAPIATVLFLLFMRISFELTIVLFRIETHLRTIREHYEKK